MKLLVDALRCALIVVLTGSGATASTAVAQGTSSTDIFAGVYERLDEQYARGQGRIGARARPAPKPVVPAADAEDGRFVGRSREAYRRDLDERFRRSIAAQQAEQAARLEAFSKEVAERCGSGSLSPATVGMTVQRFEQCSPEVRFGGGLTHVISLNVQGLAGKLYVFDGDQVHKVYAVDGHVTRIVPPPIRVLQPSVLNLGTYPPLVSDPNVVALSQGHVFAYGPAYAEDWTEPAGTKLKTWGEKRGRIHTSVPAPPFMWDAHKQGWLRFAPPPACAGLWHQHTLSVLSDDRVLVAGGLCDLSRAVNDMGTFEPQARTALWDGRQRVWLDGPSLQQPRIHHTANVLDGQRVMLVGGFDDPLTTAEQAPLVQEPARSPAVPTVRALRSVELFHAGQFEPLAPLNTARAKHTATVLPSGAVLVVGGVGDNTRALAHVEAWDPAAGRWLVRASLRTARYGHTATLLPDGRVLVTGGVDAHEALLNTTEIYDPATDSWSDGPPLPEHLQGHGALVLPDGRVLLAGGMAFPVEQRTPWLHMWRPGEPSWQALGIRGPGPHGAAYHRPALVPLGSDRVLIFSGLSVWLYRTAEAAGGSPGATANDTLPHFTDAWWVAPPAPAPAALQPPPARTGQAGLLQRVGQGLWDAREHLLVLAAVLGGMWYLGQRWKRVRQAVNSVASESSVLRKRVPAPVVRVVRNVMRVLVYGALLMLALPHLLAYLNVQLIDMADQCHTRPSACLNADTGLLSRQWSVPGRSKFSVPRIPCVFVGEWRTRLRTHEFTLALQADGSYQMKSPTPAVRDDAGYWAVQGRYILWRSTTHPVAEMDINQIVSAGGSHFELIEMDGVHTHFERQADLPRGRCQP